MKEATKRAASEALAQDGRRVTANARHQPARHLLLAGETA